ncbi:MAG: hypothetical protein COA41_09620 [Sphingopyxis sp.]|nr:MAG: hypothetical protein COA41_09620 [Sphingopyxis sp.]
MAHQHAVVGKETIIYRNGEEVERRLVPSDSIMALLIKRGDLGGRIGSRTADKVISWEEWQDGVRFDDEGSKVSEREQQEAVRRTLEAKLSAMHDKLVAERRQEQAQLRAREARAAALEAKYGGGDGER